jgi:hypothetical protein
MKELALCSPDLSLEVKERGAGEIRLEAIGVDE